MKESEKEQDIVSGRDFAHTFGKVNRNLGDFKNKYSFPSEKRKTDNDFEANLVMNETNSRILSNKNIMITEVSRNFSPDGEKSVSKNVINF